MVMTGPVGTSGSDGFIFGICTGERNYNVSSHSDLELGEHEMSVLQKKSLRTSC